MHVLPGEGPFDGQMQSVHEQRNAWSGWTEIEYIALWRRERTNKCKSLDQHRQCCCIHTPGWRSAIVQGRDVWSLKTHMHEGWTRPQTKRRKGHSTTQWSWGCILHILQLPLPVLHCAPEHTAQTMPAVIKPHTSDPICIKTVYWAHTRLFLPCPAA